MAATRRHCKNHPDAFFYRVHPKERREYIFEFVRIAYLGYFGVKLGYQDKLWDIHIVYKIFTKNLLYWTNGKRKPSIGLPIPYSDLVSIPSSCHLPKLQEDAFCASEAVNYNESDDSDSEYVGTSSSPQYSNRNELSDLISVRNFSGDSSKLLAFRLKENTAL
ncbi:hypothetical protein PR048_018714 [Dryococelus australis]|uniref:Uncharacterized protein n=1 Tax=Dryococelus australis TaxID=614101 RepID=A0ABQ9HD27_9NEOP|nr:hypothetical protein PR048_018714 [Dryococelus australis]